MIKICTECKAESKSPPSSKKVTCSRACSRVRKARLHKGKMNNWSAEARKRVSQKGVTENLMKGTPAAQISPRSGPYETNVNAKRWVLKSPEGQTFEITNLNLFCREQADKYNSTPARMSAGIRQIKLSAQGKTRRQVNTWRDWELLDFE